MVNGGFGGTSAAVLMFSFSIKIQVRKMMWERWDVCKVKMEKGGGMHEDQSDRK